MRLTAATIYRDSQASIERAAERLFEYQKQVASGKRITRASDDPAGTATSIAERAELAAVEQYTRTADSVTSRLTVADSALSDIIDRLSQARVSVVAAQGSNKTATEHEAAARTLEGIRDAIRDDLNTSFRGTYIFAGADSTSAPFVESGGTVQPYQGSTTEVQVDIDNARAVTVGIDGSTVSQGGASSDVFAVLDAAIAAARAGDSAALQQADAELRLAFDRVSNVQTRVGTSLAAIEAQHAQFADRRLASLARVSKIEDANLAEAITGMNQADAAYRASLGATSKITQLSLMDYLK
jgi:flagellar hook-associated protein 3 FlgL